MGPVSDQPFASLLCKLQNGGWLVRLSRATFRPAAMHHLLSCAILCAHISYVVEVRLQTHSCIYNWLISLLFNHTTVQLLLLEVWLVFMMCCLACMQDLLQAANAERLRLVQSLLAHGADVHAAKFTPENDGQDTAMQTWSAQKRYRQASTNFPYRRSSTKHGHIK